MAKTIVTPHGLFYMESAGGCRPAQPEIPPEMIAEEHQQSCFALEEERTLEWQRRNGTGH